MLLVTVIYGSTPSIRRPSLIARMRGFHEIGGFPGVVGALDGSHVHIMAPTGPTEPDFVNRKHVHSINVQVRRRHKAHHHKRDPMQKEIL